LALKNLGVIFSQEGDNLLALHYLRCFYKTDAMDLQYLCDSPSPWGSEQAQKHFHMLLEMPAS